MSEYLPNKLKAMSSKASTAFEEIEGRPGNVESLLEGKRVEQ